MKSSKDLKVFGWIFEIFVLFGVVVLFWQVNIYLAVCILIFHGLTLVQIFKSQNLIGFKNEIATVRTKVRAGLLVLVFSFCVMISFIKAGLPSEEKFLSITKEQLIDLANGEMFPYLILLSFMAALLMFGLTSERKNR